MPDLHDLAVVDVHCHPFLDKGEITAEQFVDLTAVGGGSRPTWEPHR